MDNEDLLFDTNQLVPNDSESSTSNSPPSSIDSNSPPSSIASVPTSRSTASNSPPSSIASVQTPTSTASSSQSSSPNSPLVSSPQIIDYTVIKQFSQIQNQSLSIEQLTNETLSYSISQNSQPCSSNNISSSLPKS
ncbi:unnamed protein product [Brachionus calyciflorus]|uniref:Uncharacterized protein n=1 Tax=Brachionus calyciflorus TaxID=104777 RepID=A0A814MAX6_9BILA|nr:unnamed protein product [Brachionus calyciflorus]